MINIKVTGIMGEKKKPTTGALRAMVLFYRRMEVKRNSYLEQPVTPTVEGGDDGGVDVAPVETLEKKHTKAQ